MIHIAPTGVAGVIVVRRSANALWLEIDGKVAVGLGPDAMVNVNVDPGHTPTVDLRLLADRVVVDNCAYVAPDDRGDEPDPAPAPAAED